VLCYRFVFVYVFHMIAFDLYNVQCKTKATISKKKTPFVLNIQNLEKRETIYENI